MAVPKTTATRCRDRAYKHCTNNPIPTSFFHAQYLLPVILQHKEICHIQKKDVGMGLFVQCLYALSLHLVAVVFGTAIPTSLYIFGKCFIYFFIIYLALCCIVFYYISSFVLHTQNFQVVPSNVECLAAYIHPDTDIQETVIHFKPSVTSSLLRTVPIETPAPPLLPCG